MKIVWSRDALSDLDEAYEFIAQDNPKAAARIIKRIEELVPSLAIHPKLGRIGRIKGTRELVITGTLFILPYFIEDERVIILAVRHGARRWPRGFRG